MVIRKMFKFENAHIVRNCTSRRCSKSIHGHSYKVEVKLKSDILDRGQMVYDFGLMKIYIKDLIDSFDHAITLWRDDNPEYLQFAKKFSERWVELPVNPTAEQFARVFFLMIDRVLQLIEFKNQEKNVKLFSVIVHETDTGYAEAFREDAYNLEKINLEDIKFSNRVMEEWKDSKMWEKILTNQKLEVPNQI